jgi:hypothetical protein
MSLKLNSAGGGSVTLQEPSTASNFVLDLPATSGTVALTSQIGGGVTSFNGATGAIEGAQRVATGTFTNASSLNITSLPSGYRFFTLVIKFQPQSGSAQYFFRLSANNVNYETSGYLGTYFLGTSDGTATSSGSLGTGINVIPGTGFNMSGGDFASSLTVVPASGGYTNFFYSGVQRNGFFNINSSNTLGSAAVSTVQAIQLVTTSAATFTGDYVVYGVRA